MRRRHLWTRPWSTKVEINADRCETEMRQSKDRLSKLRATIRSLGSAAVAFSGGADSTLVAKIAHDELGERALAVTIDSPMFPRSELKQAKVTARSVGIDHVVVRVDALKDSRLASNPPDRCYICKLGDFGEIRKIAKSRGLRHVLDGSNADDQRDYRPGAKAKEELDVQSPLAEVGLGKSEIMAISKSLRLPTADKQPSPCLASRIPYGEPITLEKLGMIEEAEEYLRSKGIEDVRVRMHGRMARIEVPPKDIDQLMTPGTRISIAKKLKSLGFSYVAIDMEGYRMGSLNEVLKK